ncbi:uncharacterized protein [Haliotis asinina]|uniref:uncharacterized protein n=1 Tax=Haliotis asinina TaxID=109174 RepID=UPI003531A0D4
MWRRHRRPSVMLIVILAHSAVFTLMSIIWVEFPKIFRVNDILNARGSNLTMPHWVIPKWLHYEKRDYSRIIVHNGTFRPSFETSNEKFTSVTSVDVYNEFEYESFRIKEPLFPRDIDRELFFKFGIGTSLLDPIPYNKLRGVVEVIRNGTSSKALSCGWPSDYSLMHGTLSKTATYFDKLCPLLSPEANSFQHFMDGLLPKLVQVRDLLLHPDMKLLITKPRKGDEKMIMSILDRMGIPEKQIIWYNGGTYTADFMVAACIAPPIHPVLWKSARALIGVAENRPIPPDKALVILLTRAYSHNGGRKILNFREVVDVLERRYSKDRVLVFKGGYSLNESMDLFGKAYLIIGVHGGALYNLYFARSTTKILEIMPYSKTGYPRGLATTIFWSMASMIGQDYWRLLIEASSEQNNIVVDLKLLNETLSKVDSVLPVKHRQMAGL